MGVLTTIGLVSLAAGTFMNARGQIKAGNEARRVGDYNAAVAEGQATDEVRRGEEEVSAFRREVRSMIGTQRAGYAGQNVDVNVGTARQVQLETERLGASDAERIRRSAERTAQGYKDEAVNQRRAGRYGQSAGRWGAAGSIIGGVAEGSMMAHRMGWIGKQKQAG